MKNRKHGEGSVSFDNTRKKWRAAFYDADDKRHYKRFDDEKSAREYLIEQINDVNKGSFIAPSKLTVGEWAIEFLETYKRNSVKATTYAHYLDQARHLSEIADILLQDVTARQVNLLYVDLQNRLSLHTIHKTHKFLSSIFKKAYETELIKKNIMTTIPAPKYEKKEIEIFTREEIEAILEICKNHLVLNKRYPMFLLAVTTGMRLGEVLGLRWCDVDFKHMEVSIKYTLSYLAGRGIQLTSPKTKTAIRKISIPIETAVELKRLKSEVVDMNIDQSTLCFRTKNGTPLYPRNTDRAWRDLLRCANVPYRKFHALRHTHATELLAAGVPIIEVSRRLGHSKISHTLELYGHAIKGYDKGIADKISNIYSIPK
ncbi:tyrosine-type recombinase/integrase [Pectinatus frisingensis]|uniref:tyrosine-type recombinase/integrase n=1 Tax=Pectinatus frisingensis TaxID=865 RepID=UPI0018C83D4D|nr:site-specific integrase [Pectinatus frisingensis]